MIVFGALSVLGVIVASEFAWPLLRFASVGRDILAIILGIIAVMGARYIDYLGWSIGLIIVGIIGSGLGGILVLVGGILGLISYSTRKR
jgi:hypothetical protein